MKKYKVALGWSERYSELNIRFANLLNELIKNDIPFEKDEVSIVSTHHLSAVDGYKNIGLDIRHLGSLYLLIDEENDAKVNEIIVRFGFQSNA